MKYQLYTETNSNSKETRKVSITEEQAARFNKVSKETGISYKLAKGKAKAEPKEEDNTITLSTAKYQISIEVSSNGELRVLDYPIQMVSSLNIVEYKGYDNEVNPFSPSHCEKVKKRVKRGLNQIVRSNYHTKISFKIPSFLNHNFFNKVALAAKKSGYSAQSFHLTNSIELRKSTAVLKWHNESLAVQIGYTDFLNNELNLGKRGFYVDENNKEMILTAGDILCDLALGNLKLTMNYPVKGSDMIIKLSFQKLSSIQS